MVNRMKKKPTIKLIAIVLVIALGLSYAMYQVVQISKSKIETETVRSETVNKTIDTKCFVVRDEHYIRNSVNGTILSFVNNGDRVASGNTVSVVFQDASDADTYVKIVELKKEIAQYAALSGQANTQAVNIVSLNTKINENVADYLDDVDKGELSAAFEKLEQFRSSATGKQIATGATLNFTKKLSELKNELSSLQKQKISYTGIKTELSGYYISGADGYEEMIAYKNIDKLTAADVTKAIASKPLSVPEDTTGRIVTSFDWYLLCVVDADQAASLSTGDEITVNFPYAAVEKLPVKVAKIGEKSDGKVLLVLKCSDMYESLANFRIEDVQIVTATYTGYKIKNSAIRTLDGQTGVFVVSGDLVAFRKAHIVYETSDYTIVDNPNSDNGYIKLYDEVITKGVELYDNKLI